MSTIVDKIVITNLFIYAAVGGLAIFVGLDPKKWFTWLLGLYGFASGAIIGFLTPASTLDLRVGAIFAFALIYGGAMVHISRRRYNKNIANVWLSRYGNNRHLSLLSRLLKKIKGK